MGNAREWQMVTKYVFNPETVARGSALFAQAIGVDLKPGSRIVYISGQVAWNARGELVGEDDFRGQFLRVYENLRSVVEGAGGAMENIVQLRTYLAAQRDLPTFIAIRNELYPQIFPRGEYPTSTIVVVAGLADPHLLLEVEAVAVL
jgi:2-iminobutanoate/2-iminopropanoate deaminase